MLRQVVRARKFLAALAALEGLVTRMQAAVVPLQVLLPPETSAAEVAHEGLGGIVGEGLLAAATRNRRGIGLGILWCRSDRGGAGSLAILLLGGRRSDSRRFLLGLLLLREALAIMAGL